FRIGFASSSQYLWQFILFIILNNLLIRWHGESALAVFNVVLNVSYVAIGLFEGVGATIQPLAATFHAEHNRMAEKQTTRLAFLWGAGLGACLLISVLFFAPSIAAIFGLSQALIPMGATALRWYALGAFFAGGSVMLAAYWQSVERALDTMLLTFLRTFVIYLLVAIPLAMGPLSVFWIVFPITECASLLVFGLFKLFRGQNVLTYSSLDALPICHHLLQGSPADLAAFLETTEEFCAEHCASMAQSMLVNMAVEEMCQAIFLHVDKAHRENRFRSCPWGMEPSSFTYEITPRLLTPSPFKPQKYPR
ncbi:MAG: MATE family efflux transporter, partial [Oscillospiraceae bacterium]